MEATIRFGVSRAHGGARLEEGARLLTAALEGRLDQPVVLSLTDDYEQVLDGILHGTLDVIWMPPLLQARALQAGAILAAVSERSGALLFRSALLVRADSRFTQLSDLRGAHAAWSDRQSASGHRFPELHLRRAGIDLAGEKVYGSALAAMTAVVQGQADFCAGFVSDGAGSDHALAHADVLQNFPSVAPSLRVLDVTDAIAPDGIVLQPHLDAALKGRLIDALLQLHKVPAGRAALLVLMGANRLVAPPGSILQLIQAAQ